GGRDRDGTPSRHHGDEGTEGEAAVRDVPRLERLVHRGRRVDLARNPVVALHIEDERIEGPLPTDEVERMVAERDPSDPSPAVFHVDRELATLVAERTEPSPSWTKYTSCLSPLRKKVSLGIDCDGFEIESVVRVPWTIGLRPRIASPSWGIRPVKM